MRAYEEGRNRFSPYQMKGEGADVTHSEVSSSQACFLGGNGPILKPEYFHCVLSFRRSATDGCPEKGCCVQLRWVTKMF
jgi:hypothetical protein